MQARRKRLAAYLDGTLGYDSNVNNSTASSTVFVPLFGLNLDLAPTSVKSGDKYFSLGGGLEYVVPLGSEEFSVFAGLDARTRINFKQDPFDYDRFDGRVGLQYASGRNYARVGLLYGRFYLDKHYSYEHNGIAGEWRHALNERDVVSVVGLYQRIRFADPTLVGNDVNQAIGGIGWTRAFNAEGTTFVFG